MSSTTYNIPLEKTMQAEVDALNRIANKLGAFDEPYSYAAIQAETRLGRISRFFQAGDQASINENGLITIEE